MLTDASKPIIHRLSKFLIPTSKSKLDHTHIPKSSICYEGIGLGIFAALERSEKYATNNQIAIKRLYFDEKVVSKCTRNSDQMMMMMMKKKKSSIFSLRVEEELEEFTGMEFLSCCNLCRKKLYGKDIYMYRGEKAFCSEECREVQIIKDERKEGYRSYGFADVGASSCPASRRDPMVSTGIFAI